MFARGISTRRRNARCNMQGGGACNDASHRRVVGGGGQDQGMGPMQLQRATPSRSHVYVDAGGSTYNGRVRAVDSYCFVIGHRTLDFPLLEISRAPLSRFPDFPPREYNARARRARDFTLPRSLSPLSPPLFFICFSFFAPLSLLCSSVLAVPSVLSFSTRFQAIRGHYRGMLA